MDECFHQTRICIPLFESGHIRVKNLGEKVHSRFLLFEYSWSIKMSIFPGNFCKDHILKCGRAFVYMSCGYLE